MNDELKRCEFCEDCPDGNYCERHDKKVKPTDLCDDFQMVDLSTGIHTWTDHRGLP